MHPPAGTLADVHVGVRPERRTFVVLALFTLALGLGVHFSGPGLPAALKDITGDALWAAMILFWIGLLSPHLTPAWRAFTAYGVCVAVEVSQLFHTPWLDAFRATTPGHLLLGSGFDGRDLWAYLAGVIVSAIIEQFIRVRRGRHPS